MIEIFILETNVFLREERKGERGRKKKKTIFFLILYYEISKVVIKAIFKLLCKF